MDSLIAQNSPQHVTALFEESVVTGQDPGRTGVRPNFYEDLAKMLTSLIRTEMLIPTHITLDNQEKYSLSSSPIEEILNICRSQEISGTISVQGNTALRKGDTKVLLQNCICLDEFHARSFHFSLTFFSGIWTPLLFDRDDYSYHWNLPVYQQNRDRLAELLQSLEEAYASYNLYIDRSEDSSEFGYFQVGDRIFIDPYIIERQMKEDNFPDFDLREYKAEIAAERVNLNR